MLSSSYDYRNITILHIPLSGSNIVSIMVMSIGTQSQLLAIDRNNDYYYVIDMNTFQVVDNGTLSPSGCNALCARQFSNVLYIGCPSNIIQVRQFQPVGNTSREEPQMLTNYSTISPPQSLAILNTEIIYYMTNIGDVYVLLTRSNTNKILHSFSGIQFASPSIVLALDSINMKLFLSSNNGTLFQLQLSSINTDNGTSLIPVWSSIDYYAMPLSVLTSVIIDKCNRLWAFASPAGSNKPEMLVFVQQQNTNSSFSMMNINNLTDSLPSFINSPYSFELNDNYSLFTANAANGIYGLYRH